MSQITNSKIYDLEERTYSFARRVVALVKLLPKTVSNIELSKQLVRAAGSVGANYIEANESLGRRDFMMRIRISKKETKEARYWLRLIDFNSREIENEKNRLLQETEELAKIFGSILEKSK